MEGNIIYDSVTYPCPPCNLQRGLWWQACCWKWSLTFMCVWFRGSLHTRHENSTPASEKQIVWWYLLNHMLFETPDLITHQTPHGRNAELFSVDHVIRDNGSSGILRSVDRQLFTDVSVQSIRPVFKIPAILSSCLGLKGGTDRFYRNVGKKTANPRCVKSQKSKDKSYTTE